MCFNDYAHFPTSTTCSRALLQALEKIPNEKRTFSLCGDSVMCVANTNSQSVIVFMETKTVKKRH